MGRSSRNFFIMLTRFFAFQIVILICSLTFNVHQNKLLNVNGERCNLHITGTLLNDRRMNYISNFLREIYFLCFLCYVITKWNFYWHALEFNQNSLFSFPTVFLGSLTTEKIEISPANILTVLKRLFCWDYLRRSVIEETLK